MKEIPELQLQLSLPNGSLIGQLISVYGMYEENTVNWLIAHQQEFTDGIFVDVGANIGWYTCIFAKLAGKNGMVFGIEPDPLNFKLLERNVGLNGFKQVQLLNFAAGEKISVANLQLGHRSNPGAHSLLPLEHSKNSIQVDVRQLDQLVIPHIPSNSKVNVLKIDIEGYEFPALLGAKELLALTKYLLIEYSPKLMRNGGIRPRELLDFLEQLGFSFFKIEESQRTIAIAKVQLLDGEIEQCDLLCLRPASTDLG